MPKTSQSRIGVALLCALMFQACASSGGTVVPADECVAPQILDQDYRIGPGDTLSIVVWRNAELSAVVPVRPDGKISTPLVDDVMASGQTPSELADNIEAELGTYIRTPQVSVIVTGQGAANQIQVVGEVVAPQPVSYREGLSVLDVIVAVGGTTEFAAANRSQLVRMVDGEQLECRIRIKNLISGDMSQNIRVYPGDVLIVPEARF